MHSSTTKKKFVTKSMRYLPPKKVLGKKLDFDSEVSMDLDNHLSRSILNLKQNQENKFRLQFSQNKLKRSMHACLTDRTNMLNSMIDLTVNKTTKQLNTIQQSFLNSPDIVKNGSMRQIVMTKKNSLISSVKQSNAGIIILTSKQLQQIRQYDKELHKVYLEVYRAYRNALQEQQKLNEQDKNLQKQYNECISKKQDILKSITQEQQKLKFLQDKQNELTVKWIKKLKSSWGVDACIKKQ